MQRDSVDGFPAVVAGLGVSLAGFSGLVAAFRRGATWQKIDAYRLRQIPEMGLAASVFALLTIPLADTVHDASATIHIGAGVVMLARPMLAFVLVLADVAEA